MPMTICNNGGGERRRHERFEVNERIFITFRPQFDRIGWVTDISKGGVALEYSTIQEYSELSEKLKVDIFSSPKKIGLFNLDCSLVYDDRADRGRGFIETIETRRCGLVFGELSQYQMAQLEAVINHCDSAKINT